MSGNVDEWCYDYGVIVSTGEETDPLGPSSGSDRATRGGCFSGFAYISSVCRRYYEDPLLTDYSQGFRLVRSAN